MVRLTKASPRRARSGPLARLWSAEEGQAVVEFALIAPLFFFLLFGMIEFARAFNVYSVVTGMAREGARAAAISNPVVTADSVRTLILNGMRLAALDPSAAVITLEGIEGESGSTARVEVRYLYRLTLLGRLGDHLFDGSPLTLGTVVEMRNE